MLFLSILLLSAQAEDLIGADRPSVATGSSVLSQGSLQVEAGIQLDKIQENSLMFSSPVMLRYGVTNRLEIRPYTNVAAFSATGSGLQLKTNIVQPGFSFLDSDLPISIGLLTSFDYSDELGGSITALLDYGTGPLVGWLNLGMGSQSFNNIYLSGSYVVGTGYLFPSNHGVFIETSGSMTDMSNMTGQVGYFWLSNNLQLDLYLQHSTPDVEHLLIATGFAYKFR